MAYDGCEICGKEKSCACYCREHHVEVCMNGRSPRLVKEEYQNGKQQAVRGHQRRR